MLTVTRGAGRGAAVTGIDEVEGAGESGLGVKALRWLGKGKRGS